MDKCLYPFSAVVGQERVKQALLCLAVEPRIGGVLLCGEKGTAKSTLVRALGALNGVKLTELPVSATEDMLLGGVELEAAMQTGRRVFQPGLLTRADGTLLYADEVNLLPAALTGALLDTMESGVCHVEREGISYTCETHFGLIGTMNPEEGTLRPQLLDRFGLYVSVTGETDPDTRKKVIHRTLDFEADPASFCARWKNQEQRLEDRIAAARALLPRIPVGEAEEETACQLARQANAAGHRGELAIIHTARALAALAGRTYLNLEDFHIAAELALPHRRREGSEAPKPEEKEENQNSQEPVKNPSSQNRQGETGQNPEQDSQPEPSDAPQNREAEQGSSREQLEHGEEVYEIRPLVSHRADRYARRGSGRRNKTRSATRRGRAVGERIPHGKTEDLAVSATLRAAAPYQLARGGGPDGLVILPSDIREKVRESRIGADIVFAVDASGSMGAARRMKEVKEAVLSMLMDSYQKRDRVGMVAFRGKEAVTVLELTRSVELAQRKLQTLPTGGRTPLAAGLEQARHMLELQLRRTKDSMPLLVLITDGRANFSPCGEDPVEEALLAARRVADAHIPAVVIDTEKQFVSLELASQLAQAMDAPCYRVEELRARPLAQLVRGHSPAAV